MSELLRSFPFFVRSLTRSFVRSFSMRCAMRRRRLQLSLSTQPCLVQRPQHRPSWSTPSCVRSYSTLLLCGAFRCPACSSFSVSLPIQHHQCNTLSCYLTQRKIGIKFYKTRANYTILSLCGPFI